ncbi:MAG: alpha/beta hydrolase-fold protein [Bryobacterales bacterium]
MKPSEAATAYKKQIGRDPSTWQWNIPIELPHLKHGVVHSASMDRDVGYNIYLPPGYTEHPYTRYPVVYYCHGATGSETSDTPVVEYVRSEIAAGRIGEVLYVFVNAGHYGGYRDNPENNVLAETYLIRELIPEIDRRYRTIATRNGRALMGFSMGGGGAVRLGPKVSGHVHRGRLVRRSDGRQS